MRKVRTSAACVAAAAFTVLLPLLPAHAAAPAPTPQSPPPTLAVSVGNGDAAVGANVEPGKLIDAILALLNALGIRGVGLALPPNGVLPAANVDVGATGAVSANASVASCPADHVCFWDKTNFTGRKLVLGSPYDESKGGGCANLPEGFQPLSVMSHLRNDRPVARKVNVTGGQVQYGIGMELERCSADLPPPDVDLGPNDSRSALHPAPAVVAYADHPTIVGGGECDEFC